MAPLRPAGPRKSRSAYRNANFELGETNQSPMLTHVTLAALLTVAQVPISGAIEGVVRGYGQRVGDPLPFASVQVTIGASRRSVVADSLGRYRIQRLAAGLVVLRVSHPGHVPATIDVQVSSGLTVTLDVDLERSPIELDPIDVLAESQRVTPPADQREDGLVIPELEVLALEASPGLGESGLGEAAAALPGNDPSDPSDVLFMRGATTDLKLVLLDGAPVYTPFHLGGLLQSFNPSSLRAAAHHVGGAPARYDGGLSYILDLRTRSPKRDRLTMTGSADLLSGQMAIEGPLNDHLSFAVSGRALHDMGSAALGSGHTPYGYEDVLGRVEARLAEGHRLTVTGFRNTESVLLNTGGASSRVAELQALPDDASWGNRVVAMAYRGGVGNVTLDASASLSDYRAELPLRPAADSLPAFDGFLASADTKRRRLTLDASAPLGDRRIRFGAAVDEITSRYSARLLLDPNSTADDAEATGVVSGVYIDGVRRLTRGVDVRAGLRADAFSSESRVRLAPRVAFLITLSPDALLTVAAGRYHQYTRATDRDVESAVSGGTPAAVTGPLLSVATADHVVLSLDQTLQGGVRLGLEGFWKNFVGLGGPGSAPLTNSGVDLRVAHRGENATAWLGYNLSWFWSGTTSLGTSSKFTGRQLLSAGIDGSFGARVGGALRLGYSAGLPFTTIPLGQQSASDDVIAPRAEGELTSENPAFSGSTLSDGFLRVDVEMFATLNTSIGGRNVAIRPYLKLLNALDRRDALFFYFEPWRDDDLRPIAERTVLPVLGVQWRF